MSIVYTQVQGCHSTLGRGQRQAFRELVSLLPLWALTFELRLNSMYARWAFSPTEPSHQPHIYLKKLTIIAPIISFMASFRSSGHKEFHPNQHVSFTKTAVNSGLSWCWKPDPHLPLPSTISHHPPCSGVQSHHYYTVGSS